MCANQHKFNGTCYQIRRLNLLTAHYWGTKSLPLAFRIMLINNNVWWFVSLWALKPNNHFFPMPWKFRKIMLKKNKNTLFRKLSNCMCLRQCFIINVFYKNSDLMCQNIIFQINVAVVWLHFFVVGYILFSKASKDLFSSK